MEKRTPETSEETKAAATQRAMPASLCSRIIVWLCAGLALSVLTLVVAFVAWTLMSYHDAMVSLQQRVAQLEKDYGDITHNLDRIVDSKVELFLEEVTLLTLELDLFHRSFLAIIPSLNLFLLFYKYLLFPFPGLDIVYL